MSTIGWAEIVTAAQQTPLGIVALLVLVVGTLASAAMLKGVCQVALWDRRSDDRCVWSRELSTSLQ